MMRKRKKGEVPAAGNVLGTRGGGLRRKRK